MQLGRLGRDERAVGAGVPADEREQGVGHGRQESLGNAGRKRDAESVPVAPGVLGRDQPLFVADACAKCSALRLEDRGVRLVELAGAKVAAQAEQVVQAVRVARLRLPT